MEVKKKENIGSNIWSDKIDFKTKISTRDKERHYVITDGTNQWDVTVVNIYAPNMKAPKYLKQLIANKGNNR